jgi:hypothetical protein
MRDLRFDTNGPPMLEPSAITTPGDRRWHLDLAPWKPYVYRGLGFDIFNPYEDEEGDGAQD